MARRSLEKRLAALLDWSGETGSAEGILGGDDREFEALASARATQEGRRHFPARDLGRLAVAVSAAESRRAERMAAAEKVSATPAVEASVATMVVTAAGLVTAGIGVAIALPSAQPRQIALGAAVAAASLTVVALKWAFGQALRVHVARRACRRASRAVDKARGAFAAARTQEHERERWTHDTTRLLVASHAFHRREAEMALEATPDADFVEENPGEHLPH